MSARVLICCGSGGVGKTSLSAALALKLAVAGERVAVLTIDPARRLADSLQVGALGNAPVRVPLAGVGSLDAMMLDARSTFDEMVRRFAADSAAAERVLANRYYQFASTRLGGSHEYMAMERLLDLAQSGRYDVVVLDTPPTRHALDFLRAPERMSGLMDQSVLRWLVLPSSDRGWRALEIGSDVAQRVLQTLLGDGTIREIAEFFEAFRGLGEGMRQRSQAVRSLLRAPSTRFLLITSPAPASRADALHFLQVLREQHMPFAGFVVNRVAAPPPDIEPAALRSAVGDAETAAQLAALSAQHAQVAGVHTRAVQALRAAGPATAGCWIIPEQEHELLETDALQRLGALLPSRSALWPESGGPRAEAALNGKA